MIVQYSRFRLSGKRNENVIIVCFYPLPTSISPHLSVGLVTISAPSPNTTRLSPRPFTSSPFSPHLGAASFSLRLRFLFHFCKAPRPRSFPPPPLTASLEETSSIILSSNSPFPLLIVTLDKPLISPNENGHPKRQWHT